MVARAFTGAHVGFRILARSHDWAILALVERSAVYRTVKHLTCGVHRFGSRLAVIREKHLYGCVVPRGGLVCAG